MKKLLLVLIAIGLGLTGVAFGVNAYRPAQPTEETGYTFARIEHGELIDSISATAVMQPLDVAIIGCELSGKVTELPVDFGQDVKAGQLLLKLDDRKALAELKEASAAIVTARAALGQAEAVHKSALLARDRFRALVSDDLGKQADVDKAQADVDAAAATIKVAESRVEQALAAEHKARLGVDLTVVRAPFDGTIIDRKVTLNRLIGPPINGHLFTLARAQHPSSALVSLVDFLGAELPQQPVSGLAVMQVLAQIAEGDINKVQVGMPARFQVYAYSDDDLRFHGRVTQIRPMPTNVQGAVFYTAVIEVANSLDPETLDSSVPQWRLRPGMTATVDLIRRQHRNVWKIPAVAVGLKLPDAQVSEAARARLAEYKDRPEWKHVWRLGDDHRPTPLFFRMNGCRPGSTDTGIQDSQFVEVLEWEPGFTLDEKENAADPMKVIIAVPLPKGLINIPKIKLS